LVDLTPPFIYPSIETLNYILFNTYNIPLANRKRQWRPPRECSLYVMAKPNGHSMVDILARRSCPLLPTARNGFEPQATLS
jgi:hypothetical protein